MKFILDTSDNIYIDMKRKDLDKVLGIPNDYSKLFSEIESNSNIIKYRTIDFKVTFNFVESVQSTDTTDYVDRNNFILKSIDIDNNKNDDEMP